jgi:Holliday junction resolvase RusA-like endonuclease
VIEVVVVGPPAPQGSKTYRGMTKQGKPVLTESSRAVKPWRALVSAAAMGAMDGSGALQGPLRVSMVFTLHRPASAPRRRREPFSRPDLSKLARATEDALTDAGLWADDAQVVEYLRLAKVYTGSGDPDAMTVPGVKISVLTEQDWEGAAARP